MRVRLGEGNYRRGVGENPEVQGDDEFPSENDLREPRDVLPISPAVAGNSSNPVATTRCRVESRYCTHKPPCKGI